MTILVVRERPQVRLRADVARGPIGPQGPGAQVASFPAAVPVSGHRGVRLDGGKLLVASVDDLGQADTCFGVTAGGGVPGALVEVRSGGLMDEASWAWTPGPIFLGLDGMLTQAPPRVAFEQRLGFAVGPTTMLVDIEPAFIFAT